MLLTTRQLVLVVFSTHVDFMRLTTTTISMMAMMTMMTMTMTTLVITKLTQIIIVSPSNDVSLCGGTNIHHS